MVKKLILASAFVFAVSLASLTGVSTVYADGNGSPDECLGTNANVLGSQEGTDDEVTVDVGAGSVVDGVCIKSGENMFDGNQHSGVLVNGTYEDDCYKVEGVGTQEVTVTRLFESSDCQGISHIDVFVSKTENGDEEEDEEDGVTLGEQVEAPTGAVKAGSGGSASSTALLAAGLTGSLAALGYGVSRLRKTE